MDALIDRSIYAALEHCTYLNQASLGLIPGTSLSVTTRFLEDVAQHGNVRMSDATEAQVLDDLRQAAAALLDAPQGSIAVLGGASEGLGQLVAVLAEPTSEVVLVSTDFPSVTYPWLGAQSRLGTAIRWVDDLSSSSLTADIIGAITPSTSAVCVSAVQYATGTSIDVAAVSERAHSVGAKVIIDATQLAGAGDVSFRRWNVDALVCSGYKWLSAAGGVALLAASEELAAAIPRIVGWKGTEDPFDFDCKHLVLARDARRFELSTMSYASAVGLHASLSMLRQLGTQNLVEHSHGLAMELNELVSPLGWHPYRTVGADDASDHIVSLRHDRLVSAAVQQTLANDHRIIVSSRGGGIRVSLHCYNDSNDLQALTDALHAVVRTAG